MKDLIKKLLVEGKSDTEIASVVLGSDHAKGMKASEIASEIAKVKAMADVEVELKKIATEKANAEAELSAKADMEKKIAVEVEASLKKIGIEDFATQFNTGKYRKENELKRFDVNSGTLVEVCKVDDKYEAGNQMLKSLLAQDFVSAKSISNEIDLDNAKRRARAMGEKITPTVSDVAGQGGYAIPTEVEATIMQMTYAQSQVYQASNKNNIIMESHIYPVMSGIAVNDIADQSTPATEAVASFANPTVAMKPCGAFSAVSNKIIRQKGADLMNAFAVAYSSALARFLDSRLIAGCITNTGDLVNGMIFDANTIKETDVTKANFGFDDLTAMASAINQECDTASLRWIYNRTVLDLIGAFETSAGDLLFPQYASGGAVMPLGYKSILNPQITSAMNVGGVARTGGTDTAILLADMSKFVVGLDSNIRIATSDQFYFTTDLTAVKMVTAYGCKQLVSNTARCLPIVP